MTFADKQGKLIGAGAALLMGLVVTAAVLASPGGGPPAGPAGLEPTATGGPEATATAAPTEDASPTESPEATETPEPAETPEADDDGHGVPPDSPACAGDLEHPNPHDTDGDGDGCRPVETEDGEKNLPDPAADAHEGHPGEIGHQHRPPHAGTPGPPGGDPPHGNGHGHDDDDEP